jgi:acetoacetate decarboxylase
LNTVLNADGTTLISNRPRVDSDYVFLKDIVLKGAWTGPAALELYPHALAPIADLPVRDVISATHLIADLTLGLGEVVHDYLV